MTRERVKKARLLNLDPSRLAFPLLLVVLLASPYPRALFFPADLLPFQVMCAGILALVVLEDLITPVARRWEADILAALAIPVLYALAYIVSVDKLGAVTETLKYLNYFAIFYIVRRCVKNTAGLRNLMRVLVLSAAGVCAIGLASALGSSSFPAAFKDGSILSTFQYRNALGGFLLAAFGCSLSLHAADNNAIESGILSAINYITALTIITTYSRGTWMVFPVAVGGLVLALPQAHRWKALYTSVASVSCAFLVLRKFWESVGSKKPETGLVWLLIGVGAAIVLEVIWRIGDRLLSQEEEIDTKYRAVIVAMAVIYTVSLGVVYTIYALDAYPNLMARVLPKQVIQRAEDIKADDSSLVGRVQNIKDAVKIAMRSPIIGHGGGAWNALYHIYQDRLYWTTETHSHYFQMLTEVGVLGVAALIWMWVSVVKRVARSRDPENDDSEWTLVVGALVAVSAISLHAAADFDLSIPANAYVVWALLGGVSGACSQYLADREVSTQGFVHSRAVRAAQVAALSVIVLVLSVLSYNLYHAGHLGAEGARWLMVTNFAQAERSYAKAIKINPWNASFYLDLAQCKIGSYFVLKDDRLVKKADEYIAQAVSVQPYNLPVRLRIVELYILQARFEDATRAAEDVVYILQMDPKSHEVLARTAVAAAMNFIHIKKPADAKAYIDKALAVLPKLGSLVHRWHKGAYGEGIDPTPELYLYTGQAFALDGQYEQALKTLNRVRNHNSVGPEATLWTGLVQAKTGQLRPALETVNQALKRRPELRSELGRLFSILGVQGLEVLP